MARTSSGVSVARSGTWQAPAVRAPAVRAPRNRPRTFTYGCPDATKYTGRDTKMHTRTAVGAATHMERRDDVNTARDLKNLAEYRYRSKGLLRRDEREPHVLSSRRKAVTRERRSPSAQGRGRPVAAVLSPAATSRTTSALYSGVNVRRFLFVPLNHLYQPVSGFGWCPRNWGKTIDPFVQFLRILLHNFDESHEAHPFARRSRRRRSHRGRGCPHVGTQSWNRSRLRG